MWKEAQNGGALVTGFRLQLDLVSCDALYVTLRPAGFGAQSFYPRLLTLASEGQRWRHTSEELSLDAARGAPSSCLASPSSSGMVQASPSLNGGKGFHFREARAEITRG